MEIYDTLGRARGSGQRAVLVTVLGVEGAAPTRPGAKVVVVDGTVAAGTLGCAEFDTAAIALAREAMASAAPQRRRWTSARHGEEHALELFAEVHEPQPAVLVFGATPVGRAVAALAHLIGRRGVLISPGGDTGVGPGVEVKADEPERYLLAAPPGSADAVIVSDHDAPWVDQVLRIALASRAAFVGMLGSRRHAPEAVARLRAAGVPDANLARLRSPCGLDIGSRTAEEIALSIVAEVVASERGASGRPLGIDWASS